MRMPLFTGLMMVLACMAAPVLAAPQKVVSLNLCTDQLAASMLPEARLKGLSFNAADPALSLVAGTASRYPALKGTTEEMASIQPDLVLMGAGQNAPLQHWLEERQVPVLTLGSPNSVRAVQAEIDKVAAALDVPEIARSLRARQNVTLGQTKLPRPGMSVAVYYPRGFSDGGGTLLHDLITRMGGRNVASKQGREGAAYLSLEEMVALNPDVLIVPLYDYDVVSQAEALAQHPALKNLDSHVVPLPGQYLTCPHLALEAVVNTVAAMVRDGIRNKEAQEQPAAPDDGA